MSDHETIHQTAQGQKENGQSGGTMSAAPPAFSLTASPPPVQRQMAGGVVQRQEEPDAEPAAETGTLSEISYLRTDDLRTKQQENNANLYFREGDTVTFVQNSATNSAWIEVRGTAYYKVGGTETSAGERTGYIQRSWTSMIRGNYSNLHVDNRTDEYGDLGTGQTITPENIIVHQTMTHDGAAVLREYDRRIDRGDHVGAQYLIDENGRIILVTAADEKTWHVGRDKHKSVTRPSAQAGTPEWTAQMQTVRQQIEDYYTELTTRSIPQDQRDRLLALDDEALFAILEGQGWLIFSDVGNNDSVGIEVVGYPEQLYDPNNEPAFNADTMEEIRTRIQGLSLAPELKAQLLQTEARAAIEANNDLSEEQKAAQLTALDRELYRLLNDYDWYIYLDISAEQKYASWMLIQELCQDFGMEAANDVYAHNQTSMKTLGEGENNMEFTRTMVEFQTRLTAVTADLAARNIPLTGELEFLAQWQAKVASMNTGEMLQPGEEGYDEMIAFFDNFWTYSAQLTSVETILANAEGIAQDVLVRRIGEVNG